MKLLGYNVQQSREEMTSKLAASASLVGANNLPWKVNIRPQRG